MTPDQFITKWQDVTLKERSASQEHFLDLCHLLDEPTPAAADPTGAWYCFERGAAKAGGGDGWADVWRRNCFGWEYKGKHKDLQAAFRQLQLYTPALEYPPLLIVCDMDRIVIHTAFTGTVPDVHVLLLEDLRDAGKRRLLKWAFTEPERLRPGQTTAALTEAAAGSFGGLAQALRARGHDPWAVGHFCIRVLFCLFAEDIELLPRQLFARLLDAGLKDPASLPAMLEDLFGAMAIAEAAHRLNERRENWLNPPGWVDRVPEVVPGYPDRIIPKPEHAAELKKKTLTNLYNARPTWLANAHQALDAAVAAAYGWADYRPEMAEEEISRRLLAMNLERSA